jgi:hypothetical protein
LQYFLPFAKDGINKQIEAAILRADKMGVKVVTLAALNKVSAVVIDLTSTDLGRFRCIERHERARSEQG